MRRFSIRTRRLCILIIGLLFLVRVVAFGQEMIFQYSFPTEAMLAQDVYIKYGGGLACDQAGNVWVADSGEGVIVKVDPAGRFLRKFGRRGQGPGELSRPMTIHVTEDGDLLILDFGNQRMAVLSGEGEFKRSFRLRLRYEDFCEFKGKIYLVYNGLREDGKTVDVLSLEGIPLGSLGEAPDFGPVIPDLMRMANFKGISCDPKGRLLVGWSFFPIVHILDAGQKEKMSKIEIDDPRLKKKYKNNLGELNVQKENPQVLWVVQRIRAHQDGFIVSIPAERIEFLDCDLKGKVRAIYWASKPEEERYLGRDFVFRKEGKTIWIYILQTMPESVVNVYKVEAVSF